MDVEVVLEPAEPYRASMSAIVGANVRAAREIHGWSREALRARLEARGFVVSDRTLRRLEGGERPVTTDELVVLGIVLGVTPLVLLCPPAGWVVVARDGTPLTDEEAGEEIVLGSSIVRPPRRDPDRDSAIDWNGVPESWRAWLKGRDVDATDEMLFRPPEGVREWAVDTWVQARRMIIYAPQELFDALDLIEQGSPDRDERLRLIKLFWAQLPNPIRRELENALVTKNFSGVPSGWDVFSWSTEALKKRLASPRAPG